MKKKNNVEKKPFIIAAAIAGVTAVCVGLGKAFKSMKKSAKAQHEADKAEFEAVKAESKASFEENRGHNTYAMAKEMAKQSWDDAHMSPSEREERKQAELGERVAEANARADAANERYENAKKK